MNFCQAHNQSIRRWWSTQTSAPTSTGVLNLLCHWDTDFVESTNNFSYTKSTGVVIDTTYSVFGTGCVAIPQNTSITYNMVNNIDLTSFSYEYYYPYNNTYYGNTSLIVTTIGGLIITHATYFHPGSVSINGTSYSFTYPESATTTPKHIAFTFEENVFRVFINGVIMNVNNTVSVGAVPTSGSTINIQNTKKNTAYLNELRLVTGKALHTKSGSTYTYPVPTQKYTGSETL